MNIPDLDTLKELQRRLNGKCSTSISSCPNAIIQNKMHCEWCKYEFGFLYEPSYFDPELRPCPCTNTNKEGEVILHLDQIIESMEEEK